MRTNIDIDDELMRKAMKATRATTKKGAVEACMRKVLQLKAQERIKRWRGKIRWEGDLAQMRESRFLNESGFFDQEFEGKKPESAKTKPTQKRKTA